MKLSLIVAMGKSRQIGKNNQMLWHISEDFKKFKQITMGKVILMGRKTFDSIGKALPGRTTIVITRNKEWQAKSVHTASSLEEAINKAKEINLSEEVIICGGGHIYQESISLVDTMYLSLVEFDGEADVFFPEFENSNYKEVKVEHFIATEKSPAWDFVELEKEL